MRQRTSPRLRQKMTYRYIAVGIAMALIVGAGVFVYLNFGTGIDSKAAASKQLVYSKQSGVWSDASIWEPRLPATGDSIVIQEGHKIDLMNTMALEAVAMVVKGNLWIDHASQLQLSNGAKIEVVNPSGSIDGGKASGQAANAKSTRITYNGQSIWDASMGPVYGYSTLSSTGYTAYGTLPVQLVYFKTKVENGKVIAEWATASETNNDYFTLERSADGQTFEEVSRVAGAGNSNQTLTYSYTDDYPVNGPSYYRLKQTDYDGKFEIFKLAAVEVKAVQELQANTLSVNKVGPNPFDYNFFVDFELSADGPVEVRLMNMQGSVVASEVVEGYRGNNRYDFDDRQGLPTGTYILNLVQNNSSTKAIRLVKR